MGLGKDYFATTAILRVLYELNCLKKPQHTLGLAAGEPIHIVPISKTVAAARRVVFGGICKKLNLSNWFRGKYVETMEEVRFKQKGIYIVGGASQDASALGLNVIAAIVDESNFLGEGKVTTGSASSKAEDKATMIYNALARRVKSRYRRHGVNGLVLLVSSKRSTEDFTERRIKQAIKDDDRTLFVRDYAIWNVHPEPFKDQEWHKVLVSPKAGRCRVLNKEEETANDDPDSLVFEFPDDYLPEFMSDPDGATRDIAGIATDFVGRLFIANRVSLIDMQEEDRPHWFGVDEWQTDKILHIRWDRFMTKGAKGDPVCACCPNSMRHVHIDLSSNHCATGFAIGHVGGHEKVWRRDPATGERIHEDAVVIHFDCVLRIIAPNQGDIDHGEVRGLVYRLMQGGVPIRSVSMDQYMATSNLQLFKRRGLRTEEIGERKNRLRVQIAARQALYERRVKMPPYENLVKELKDLELDPKTGKRVVATGKGTKDLADAWAGVIYYINNHSRAGVVLAPTAGVGEADKSGRPQWHSGGDIEWGDEDDLPPLNEKADEGGQGSWIVLG